MPNGYILLILLLTFTDRRWTPVNSVSCFIDKTPLIVGSGAINVVPIIAAYLTGGPKVTRACFSVDICIPCCL